MITRSKQQSAARPQAPIAPARRTAPKLSIRDCAHPVLGAALEALTQRDPQPLGIGPLEPGHVSAVAEEARSHDDVIDESDLAPVVTIDDQDLANYRWGRGDYRGQRELLSDLYGVTRVFR